MPLSSGTFTRDYDYTADRDAGDPTNKISATKVDADFDQIAAALSLALYRDGQATATANIPMGGYKFTGLATSASARTDSVSAGIVQDGKLNWVDGGGTADAITATYSPAITALVDGQLCCVRATAANATTTPTFAPNGLTARTIVKNGGSALAAGDIGGDGHELLLRYDLSNTRWELLNPKQSVATPPSAASDSAAGIVELATAAETTTGTDATRAITPDGLAGSDYGKRVVTLQVSDPNGSAITTGDGKAYWRVPAVLNGWNLVAVAAHVTTVSSSGAPAIQIHNVTDTQDMLSTALTIDQSEKDSATAATAAVINGSYDDVATGDELRIDIDTAGTGAKGLMVELTFQAP